MINVELMQETLDYIAAHPEEHDQGDWAQRTGCKTTRCMAGTVVHLAPGYKLLWHREQDGKYDYTSTAVDNSGRTHSVPDLAEELLGVNHQQANDLFYNSGTLNDLYARAEEITHLDMRLPERELVDA